MDDTGCDDFEDFLSEYDPETGQSYIMHLVPCQSAPDDGYWCVVCMQFLPREEDGRIVHEDIAHPPLMTFDEDRFPQ